MEDEKMKKLEENKKTIEEELRKSDGTYVVIQGIAHCTDVQYASPKEFDHYRKTKVIPKALAKLYEKKIIKLPNLFAEEGRKYFFVFEDTEIIHPDDVFMEDREKIEKYDAQIRAIKFSKSKTYDKKGNANFHTEDGDIKIPCTQRELAGMGILAEDVEWEPEVISKEGIAKSTKSLPGRILEQAGRFLIDLSERMEGREDDR